jgi:sugar phosphate isomerase/epimerase
VVDFSFQLYSARKFTPWDKVLARVAELGYTQVEGFGGVYEDAASFRSRLDRLGLSMTSGHFGLDALEQSFDDVQRTCDALGITHVFCPFLMADQRPADEAGWKGVAERLAAIGEGVAAGGRRFGWHNHDFEFRPLDDGSIPMETILTGAPSIGWEADIAWVIRGGGDPMDWIKRHGARITAVHVKDIAPEGECADEDGWADVGHGVVAWKNILRAIRAESPAEVFVMEHDNPSDYDRFARRSIEAARNY